MLRLLKKELKIFGTAVPVSVLLLGLVTTVALAGFVTALLGDLSVTARSGPSVSYDYIECTVPAGTNGTNTQCDLTANQVTAAWEGIDDTTQLKIVARVTPADPVTLTFQEPLPLPDGITRFDCQTDTGAACDGLALTAGTQYELWVYVETADIVADQSIPNIDFQYHFED